MKNFKLYSFIFAILISTANLNADTPYFLDFKYILNESEAGKKAQNFLKNKLETGIKDLKNKEKKIQEEEKKNNSSKKSDFFRRVQKASRKFKI